MAGLVAFFLSFTAGNQLKNNVAKNQLRCEVQPASNHERQPVIKCTQSEQDFAFVKRVVEWSSYHLNAEASRMRPKSFNVQLSFIAPVFYVNLNLFDCKQQIDACDDYLNSEDTPKQVIQYSPWLEILSVKELSVYFEVAETIDKVDPNHHWYHHGVDKTVKFYVCLWHRHVL